MISKIIDRPVLAIIFFSIIILLGAYSFNNMTIGLVPDPEQGLPSLNISYIWIGSSPDMMLEKVLIPAEAEIMKEVKGISKISSRAVMGSGTLTVEFNRNIKMNFAHLVLRERLNRLQNELPKSVRPPNISERIPDDFEQKPLFSIGIYGKNYNIYSLRKIAEKEIHPHLRSIPGVKEVNLEGGVEPQIQIRTNIRKLDKFSVSITDIQGKIYQYFFTNQSISFKKASGEITLSLSVSPENIQDIQNIFIKNFGEKKLFLKDLADVYLGFEELRLEKKFQGQSFLVFSIYKESSYSHLEMANKIKSKMKLLANRLGGRIEFVIQSDDSKVLRRELYKLSKIAFLILIIIFVILIIIVRDIKATILIFSSVFFSVFATLTVIHLAEIPLNLLTLSGLALGFGLFVDNAVVVFDSILRFREKGYDLKESAVEGARAVILPVLSSTFTTIIVFFSFAILFRERLKVYYLPLAYIIAISLISSIVVSFVLIPSLSARLKIKIKNNNKNFKKGKFFPFLLKYPMVIIAPVMLAFFFSYTTFKKEVSFGQFFSWYSQEEIRVSLRFPSGAEFSDIQDAMSKFEKLALSKPYKKEINTTIYTRGAFMRITFPESVENTAYPVQLKQELVGIATNLAGIGVSVTGFDQEPYFYNPSTGSNLPWEIHVKGYHFEKLMQYCKKIKNELLAHKRIKEAEVQTDMKFWWGGKEKYFSLKLNREKLKIYKLEPRYLLTLLLTTLRESANTQKLKFDEKELSIEIKVAGVKDIELDDILDLHQTSRENIPFRIRDIVDVDFSTQKGGITRENQQYEAMIQWDYLGSNKAADRFHKTIYDNLQVPVGFTKSLKERSFRLTREEEDQLSWAILLSLLLIYLILGMLYENFLQPILIMLSIPLALIGVFIAFVVLDYSFDSTAYIGVILLFGIVVNNAILLIDNINRHLKSSTKIIDSIVIATKERIRPIFMTTMTTVLGMTPLLIFKESGAGKSDIWSSLALCTVGGLTTSALLILLILPIFYYLFYKLQKNVFASKSGFKTTNS
ncbi:MAG: efflux RND transporter permease subunit [Acidobacteriota bacterium]